MGMCRRLVGVLAAVVLGVPTLTGTASADGGTPTGHIDHVEARDGAVQALFSITDLPQGEAPDLSSASVRIDGSTVRATAVPASGGADQTRRSAMLVVDSSESMRGRSFNEAKAAALTFIDRAPHDVEVGLVSFGRTVTTVQAPTLDRSALRSGVAGLRLSVGTRLYDGVIAALSPSGALGQRRLLVLTDGRDTTRTPLRSVETAVRRAGDQVDVVGLGVSRRVAVKLGRIAAAGQGTLVNADDAGALTMLFREEAQALAAQMLISFSVPKGKAGSDANLAVSVDAQGVTYTDSAFVSLGGRRPSVGSTTTPLSVGQSAEPTVSRPIMFAAVGAIGLAMLLVMVGLFGLSRPQQEVSLEDRLSGYGRSGVPVASAKSVSVKDSALGLTKKVISGGVETKLALRLDAAGLSFKPAEWVLLHAGLALAAAFGGFLLSNGGGPLTVLFLLGGAIGPWLYLGVTASRRIKAFNSQLAEGLQLMSGGLKAGLSMAQSVDTIVREGTEPMAGEFRRALAQARLGVDIEDALDRVAARMSSEDFRWVVMAIRIQRQVGGNLAELLLTVAATLREREYLRRQVQTLTAEGRLSAWVLGGLPPVFLGYLMLSQGDYVSPMFHTALGWVMLSVAAVLLAVGAFWMSKTVKVEV
jgi:tight adherence protein B